jgi:hypothetical protein
MEAIGKQRDKSVLVRAEAPSAEPDGAVLADGWQRGLEIELFSFLFRNPGAVFSTRELYAKVREQNLLSYSAEL